MTRRRTGAAALAVASVLALGGAARGRDLPAREPGGDPPPASEPVRVMSFNIRYGTAEDGENARARRRDLVVETIRAFDPDVPGLQEALRFQLDELAEALPGYTEVGVGRDDGAQAGECAAILFRTTRFERLASGGRIDAIPVSGDWEVREARVVRASRDGRYPSDHFPVTAVLARRRS